LCVVKNKQKELIITGNKFPDHKPQVVYEGTTCLLSPQFLPSHRPLFYLFALCVYMCTRTVTAKAKFCCVGEIFCQSALPQNCIEYCKQGLADLKQFVGKPYVGYFASVVLLGGVEQNKNSIYIKATVLQGVLCKSRRYSYILL
jgi:hypothetical protein